MQVVRLLGVCTQERPLMIIMEYVSRGSLKDVLVSSKPTPEGLEIFPSESSRMCYDVACGMQFLSSKGFVHRDLAARFFDWKITTFIYKFRNCLVDEDQTVKISDFGMSRQLVSQGLIFLFI